jgi:hypothetical protein
MMEQSGTADHDPQREKRKQTREEIVSRLQARIVKAQAGECAQRRGPGPGSAAGLTGGAFTARRFMRGSSPAVCLKFGLYNT